MPGGAFIFSQLYINTTNRKKKTIEKKKSHSKPKPLKIDHLDIQPTQAIDQAGYLATKLP